MVAVPFIPFKSKPKSPFSQKDIPAEPYDQLSSVDSEDWQKYKPYIFRESYVISQEMKEAYGDQAEKYAEEQMEQRMMHYVRQSGNILTKRIVNDRGYTVIMKLLQLKPQLLHA